MILFRKLFNVRGGGRSRIDSDSVIWRLEHGQKEKERETERERERDRERERVRNVTTRTGPSPQNTTLPQPG